MARANTDSHEMTNRRLDNRYELRERVGSGGMAEVWEGFDHNLGRQIAIKMLHSHLAADPTVLARFRSEAKAAARLTHPAIVAIYDTVGTQDNDAIIMEFVEGRDLRTILNERPTLAAADAVEVGLQLAGALGHAHQNGIVHRDVKPANILVRPDRRVKLSDFGIAKALDQVGHTETGSLVGTVKYLAPEQIEGKPVDGRTDLYGLSTVLYEMLCGQVPFAASDLMGAMKRLRKDAPSARVLRPDLPIALDKFLQRGLARNPEHRHANAAEWASELRESMLGSLVMERGDPTVVAPPPSTPTSIPLRQPSIAEEVPKANIPPTATTHPPRRSAQNDVWSTDLPAARPNAKQRSKPDPNTAKHLKKSRSRMRWLGPVISLVLMIAAIATVWFLLTNSGASFIERITGGDNPTASDNTEDPAPSEGDVDPAGEDGAGEAAEQIDQPLFTTDFNSDGFRATSFDPFGNDDGEEHEAEVSLPFDGDPDTFWATSQYGNRNFGQLKRGVGLIVEFGEPQSMQDIEFVTNRTGWAFDLYAADVAQASLADWEEPIDSFTNLDPTGVVDVDVESGRTANRGSADHGNSILVIGPT